MLKFILANKKMLGGVTAVLTAVILSYQVYNHIYERGRLDERIEMQARVNAQFEAQRREYERLLQERITQIADDYEAQLELEREKVRVEYRTQEVIRYVDREIVVPAECTDLANNVISVLQQATGIVTGATNNRARSTD